MKTLLPLFNSKSLRRSISVLFLFFSMLINNGSIFAQDYDIETLLVPDSVMQDDRYGTAVAIDGNYAVVGAFLDDIYGLAKGATYIFKFNGNNWEQQVKLTPGPDGDGEGYFGASVAINGNRVVIGAPWANNSWGAVYVYYFDGLNWIEETSFFENSVGEGGNLGKSVAINGDMILAGADQCSDSTEIDNSGAVYVYKYNSSSWERQQVFLAEDHELYAFFGNSIDIDGDQAIIGAFQDGSGDFTDHGAAYIFKYNGILWEQQAKLIAEDISNYTYFGTSVAIEGNIAVVGEPDPEMGGPGSTYVFKYNGSAWEQTEKFTLETDGKRFGQSVAIHNNRIVVGARPRTYSVTSPGYAYIYEYSNTQNQWIEKTIIEGEGGNFGQSVDISGNFVVAGGLIYDSYDGQASVFELIAHPYPVNISNGVHNNRINISWENRSNSVENFKIYRDGEELTTESGSAGTYNDYNAVPGKIYTYGVSAINSFWGESSIISSSGWSKTNGRIDGNVTTIMGAGVNEVQLLVSPVDPEMSTALEFDGMDDYIEISNSKDFNNEHWSIEAWINPRGGSEILYRPLGTDSSFQLQYYPENMNVGFGFKDTLGTEFYTISTNNSVPLDEWTHIAAVCDTALLKIYINGQLNASVTYPEFPNNSSLPLWIARGDDGYFEGQIDEIRMWDTPLDSTAIRNNMNYILQGTEENLVAYWALDDSSRSGERVAADYTKGGGHHGIIYGAQWVSDAANTTYGTLTDPNGDFMIRNIYYDEVRDFSITPVKEDHGFDPGYRTRTLETTVPTASNVMFTDTTTFTVIGHIEYAGTNCNVKGVEVLLDDFPTGISTNSQGIFRLSIEQPGIHTITPQFGDSSVAHVFIPNDTTMDIREDIPDLQFTDVETHMVSGKVKAACNASIGTASIEFRSIDHNESVFVDTIETASDGTYQVVLPAQKYRADIIDLDPYNPIIIQYFESDTVDLTWQVQEKNFIYRTPPVIRISGIDEYGCGAYSVPIVHQYDLYNLTIDVLDAFGTDTCFVEEGIITIYDDIGGDPSNPDTIELVNGTATYSFIAGEPNILSGGDHPYQKLFQVTAEVGQENSSFEQWILITGHRPREQTYATVSPELPFMILRDPPGDASYSYLEEQTTTRTAMRLYAAENLSMNVWAELRLGVQFEAGFIFSTETDIWGTIRGSLEVGAGMRNEHEYSLEINNSERFYTSGNPHITGESGDVFAGAAMNMIYALSDVIAFDYDSCKVDKYLTVVVGMDGFATTFMYTENHIENVLIPQLEQLRDIYIQSGSDSAQYYMDQISTWQQTLSLNDSLKQNAEFLENRSFSAGAPFESAQTVTTSSSSGIEFSLYIEEQIALAAGLEVGGSGFSGGVQITSRMEMGASMVSGVTSSRTTGFVFNDDDIGDFFSVDVKADPTYGTPVFETVSGRSSCPWEDGTQPRDGVDLSINTYAQFDIPPDDPATFILNLGNTTQSDEAREYHLRMIQGTNPDGAVIKVAGVPMGGALSYFIPPGEQFTAALTVERGPLAYDYENMRIMLYPPCQYELWQNNLPIMIADTVNFSVHFQSPCSDVNLLLPENNWVVNLSNNDTLQVIINDYDINNQYLQSIKFQYRRLGENWETAFFYIGNSIPQDYILEYWDVSDLLDGTYELRVVTDCDAMGLDYSGISTGIIDRNALMVLGTPEPSDGILNIGEDISVTFTDDIDQEYIDESENISLLSEDLIPININFAVYENTLFISTVEEISTYENQTLTAAVFGIKDIHGNEQRSPVEWSFRVSQNPVYWTVSNVNQTIYQGSQESILRTLKNAGGEEQSFTITQYPAWLSPSPVNGNIPAEGEQEITFTIDDQLNPGTYHDTVFVATSHGDEPLIVNLEVLVEPPAWSVNAAAYSYNMNITAQIAFEELLSEDVFDIVSVYSGDDIRGIANVEFVPAVDKYLAFLTVYSNQASGETLTFRMWDASAGREFASVGGNYTFENNGSLGNASNPVLIESDASVQSIALNQGWSWVSLNVEPVNLSVASSLSEINPVSGDIIKSQTAFSQYYEGVGWQGSLKQIEIGKSYSINAANTNTMRNTGSPVDVETTSIPVESGWNWIGYFHQEILDINDALATMPASAGDRIKSQTGFAEYISSTGTWEGSLDKLNPGQGYLLKSNTGGDLEYPALNKAVDQENIITYLEKPEWSVNVKEYEYSMSYTAVFEFDEQELRDTSVIISAFNNDQCCGVSKLQYIPELEKHIAFLLVYSNNAEGDTLSFKIYLPEEDLTRQVEETAMFTSDEINGNLESPFVFTALPIGDELVPYSFYLNQNYPNPFNPGTTIEYGLPTDQKVKLQIFNILGQKVATLVNERQEAGRYKVTFNATKPTLPNGVYFYYLKTGDYKKTRKMLILK